MCNLLYKAILEPAKYDGRKDNYIFISGIISGSIYYASLDGLSGNFTLLFFLVATQRGGQARHPLGCIGQVT